MSATYLIVALSAMGMGATFTIVQWVPRSALLHCERGSNLQVSPREL